MDRRGDHRLRRRPALRLQERPGARPLLRPGRVLAPPLRRLDARGRWVLRLQGRHGRLRRDRSSPRMERSHGPGQRVDPRSAVIDRVRERGFAVETAALDKGYDVGPIYVGCEARDVRPIIPLRDTPAVVKGENKLPMCEHGEWPFRRCGLRSEGDQIALPDRRAQARLPLDQGRPPAPAHPVRNAPLHRPGPPPPPSSESLAAPGNTSGRCIRSASVAWNGSGSTPT
jgi:hypothetical protein